MTCGRRALALKLPAKSEDDIHADPAFDFHVPALRRQASEPIARGEAEKRQELTQNLAEERSKHAACDTCIEREKMHPDLVTCSSYDMLHKSNLPGLNMFQFNVFKSQT